MSTSKTQVITNCGSAVEAEQIRGLLEEHGVPAFVDGANTVTALAYIGSALGGVRVVVHAHDAQQAMELLESLRRPALDSTAWFCGPCQEEIDAEFEVCWSCGQPREAVQQPFPTHNAEARDITDVESDDETDDSPFDAADPRDPNPYASPRTSQATAYDPIALIHEEAEALLLRAWRASILGTVFLPFIAHFYSMYLLICAATTTPTFSPAGSRRFKLTLALNLLAAAFAGILIFLMLGG